MTKKQKEPTPFQPSEGDKAFSIELHNVPIVWDLEAGSFTFFGLDSALFWTDPSLVRMLAPLVEEMGIDLFRLLVADSSSQGTKEDYYSMVSILGRSFAEGFSAWGKAVSSAGWGDFEMTEYDREARMATVVVRNPWELSMQRSLSPEKRWGCPFLQGKLIGLFSEAFRMQCWADDQCEYAEGGYRVVFRVYPSCKTIKEEIKKLRQVRMQERELFLAQQVEKKTGELMQAKNKLEMQTKNLEKTVAERTAELRLSNENLQREIDVRKQAQAEKEKLIAELQETLQQVKTLSGLLPICSSCKKIRDDKGYWNQIEEYISNHSDAQFSHGLCDECIEKLYGKEEWYIQSKSQKKDDAE